MMDNFYVEFEQNFRGTREEILRRLNAYNDYLTPYQHLQPQAWALDLGCGRGEWLEKCQQLGFAVHGVDLDEAMLQSCKDKGLQVACQDALSYLESLPHDSQTIVTAFHLVEHISFEQLRTLLTQAMRVLKPAGLLIMETPNPENLVVATRNFYLDPTHIKPIPPELLTFLARQTGYERVQLLRLQENPALAEQSEILLTDVIHGVSPDYAVITQKAGSAGQMDMLASAFTQHKGIGLQTMVERYDQFIRTQSQAIQQQLQTLAQQQGLLHEQSQKLQQVQAELRHWQQQTLSWKVGQWGGWLRLQVERLQQQGIRKRAQALLRKIATRCQRVIDTQPRLRQQLVRILKTTGTDRLVKRWLQVPLVQTNFLNASLPRSARDGSSQPLSARAQNIKAQLKQAMTEQGKP